MRVQKDSTSAIETRLIQSVEWSEIFSVNNAEIDHQHKMLISMINRCVVLIVSEKQSKEEISTILDEMLGYADFHFGYEEQFMRDTHYPHLLDHQKEHKQFFAYLKEAVVRYDKGRLSAVDLLKFLKDWFVHHILGMDQLYAIK